ncbi:MAG: hydrolase [Myxococcota bacterium]
MSRAKDDVLLNPDNHAVVLIDHQSQMLFGVQSHDGAEIVNNTLGLAKAARLFGVPVVLTTVNERFSGPLFEGLAEALGNPPRVERTTVNAWEDPRVVDAVRKTGRRVVVLAGLWTEVCVAFPALYALRDDFDVCVVADACGGQTRESHEMGMQRMIQAGAQPLTSAAYLYELQRDWARQQTYAGVIDVVRAHQRRFAVGVQYNRFLSKVPEPA